MNLWRSFICSGVAILASSALLPSSNRILSPGLVVQAETIAEAPQIVSYVLKDIETLESQALQRTETLRSQPWNGENFDREWYDIKALWVQAAQEAADFLPENNAQSDLHSDHVGTLVSSKLQPLYYEYMNRQNLTDAMHAHHKSVHLAKQPEAGSIEQCDVEGTFADSPEKWAEIVVLRQRSVQHLADVSEHVSFYPDVVLPLQKHYQEKLDFATRFYVHSPWYYAIQKAVCATEWGEKAERSGKQSDWAQAAALWEQGIVLLEEAPDVIPANIEGKERENYQTAQDNLEMWRANFRDASARAQTITAYSNRI